jgi:carbon monoxide dehydrogenase subunit G
MWYMKPVRVSIEVPQGREDVFDFLDVLANHEQFTDHMLTGWHCSGPARGTGAKATMKTAVGGRSEAIDMEVIDAERPVRTVERNVSAGGRVMTGTYTLDERPGGGTRVTFEAGFVTVPRSQALLGPLLRSALRHGNQRALQRLAETLRGRQAAGAGG